MHRCPKCAGEFELVPQEETALPVEYKLPPSEFDFSAAYEKPEAAVLVSDSAAATEPEATQSTATASDVIPIPAPQPPAPPPAVSIDPGYTPPPQLETPMIMVLVAGVVFGVAMIATQFTYGRIIAIPLLLAGLFTALVALPGLDAWRRFGIAAIAVNAMGLLFVLFLPGWLGAGRWLPEGDPNAEPKIAFAVPRDGRPPRPADWVDSVAEVWRQDDVTVEVSRANVEPLDPKAARGTPNARPVLRLTLRIGNVGVARGLTIGAWKPEAPIRLAQQSGPVIPLRKVETTLPAVLMPGKELEVILQFEVPPGGGSMQLELPAAGLETADPARFTIPWR